MRLLLFIVLNVFYKKGILKGYPLKLTKDPERSEGDFA